MKIYYDQGYNNIGVVIATKWRHYLFYLQHYFSALGTFLPKSFTGAFPPIATSMFVKHALWGKKRKCARKEFFLELTKLYFNFKLKIKYNLIHSFVKVTSKLNKCLLKVYQSLPKLLEVWSVSCNSLLAMILILVVTWLV